MLDRLTLTCSGVALAALLAACSAPSDRSPHSSAQGERAQLTALEAGFRNPPPAARPRTWWHWIDSNVTRDGISKDLEWMQRVGIGGFHMFDVGVGVGHYVENPALFMTPQWLDLLEHTAKEAKRLDLEMTYHAAGGWSQTGGPWVSAEQGMKKLVWSSTRFSGPGRLPAPLPQPSDVSGPFQDVPKERAIRLPELHGSVAASARAEPLDKPPPRHYRDQHVFAYPTPAAQSALASAAVQVHSNAGPVDTALLADGLFAGGMALAYLDEPAAVTFNFDQPVTVDSVTIGLGHGFPQGLVQVSRDGRNWHTLAELPGQTHEWINASARTLAFPQTTARHFRLLLTSPAPPHRFAALLGIDAPAHYTLTELRWSAGRINRAEDKAGFGLIYDYAAAATPATAAAVAPGTVLDLSDRLRADGTLDWEAPPGDWTVLRMGYSLTGVTNHPATNESLGLEVDKLNAEHVTAYLDGLLQPLAEHAADILGKGGIEYLLLDSWEAGLTNWTDDMFARFQALRGYDPRPYAPALAGQVVGDAAATERFLYDWRLTLSDLLAQNHNGVIQAYANARGLGVYAESMGTRMATMGNGMQLKAMAEVPMAEFWYVPPGDPGNQLDPRYRTDIREAAAVANIYGQNLVAAEAFTTLPFHPPWGQGPRELKWVGDYYFTEGVNRIVIHSSDHQPLDDFAPGFTLWQFGQFLTRHETWAEQSKGWIDYLARSSFMLQQGKHIADVAILLGEGAPLSVPFWDDTQPGVPPGYDYDYIDAETVIDNLKVEDGYYVTPGGSRYRLLVLPAHHDRLTVAMAGRLEALVKAGGALLAPRPLGSPSLADGAGADAAVATVADRLWGPSTDAVKGRQQSRQVGAGRVYAGMSIGAALNDLGIEADVSLAENAPLKWTHRATDAVDLYFVTNLGDSPISTEARFRVSGRDVSLWYPETAKILPASYRSGDSDTAVTLDLDTHESVFVVFAGAAPAPARQLPLPQLRRIATVPGPWTVTFLDAGGPQQPLTLQTLAPWHTSDHPPVRYYSGTARYTTTFELPQAAADQPQDLLLDLGEVGQIAEVWLNGRPLGSDWMPPYRIELGAAARPGKNQLEIQVTNLWANRLIGDAGLALGETVGKNVYRPYTQGTLYTQVTGLGRDHPLFPSGLAGPVRIYARHSEPQ